MKLNDQKVNNHLTVFPSAYNTNMTASFKYLSRDSSAIKADKSILKSPSAQQLLCKSNRGSDKKVRIQESATKDSVQGRNTSQFGRVSAEILYAPPMRSLNREDREKLIVTLIQQVKSQNSQIQQLEFKMHHQEEQLDELNLYNEKYEQKEQCYGELLQNQNKINSRIQQIAELKEMEEQSTDYLEIINRIYEDEVDFDMAIKWRNARLQFNFLDALYRATKYSKKLSVVFKQQQQKTIENCFQNWKFISKKKQLLNQFGEVQQLRTVIKHWIGWKDFIQNKKQYTKNLGISIQYHNQKLMKKSIVSLKDYYLQYNFKLKDFTQISKQAILQLERLKQFKVSTYYIRDFQQMDCMGQKRKLKIKNHISTNNKLKIKINEASHSIFKIECFFSPRTMQRYCKIKNYIENQFNVQLIKIKLEGEQIQSKLNQIEQEFFYQIQINVIMDKRIFQIIEIKLYKLKDTRKEINIVSIKKQYAQYLQYLTQSL